MKKFTIRTLFLVVTLCAVCIVAISQYFALHPHDFKAHNIADVVFSSHGLNEITESKVSQVDADASPAWNLTNPNPPISALRALSIANDVRKERLIESDKWRWELDSLTLYPLDERNNKWCWCVTFEAFPKRGPLLGIAPCFRVFVLMNGKIAPLESTEYDYLKDWGILTDS